MFENLFNSMKGFLVGVIIEFLVKLVNGLVPDTDVKAAGVKAGKFISTECREALGEDWEKAESLLEEKLGMFISGLYAGLDADDKEK